MTGTITGPAARMAGERYLGMDADRNKDAARQHALGGLRPLMKVAQISSTIPDAVVPEYAEELSASQADAPSMGWLFVKRRMAAELGGDWSPEFGSFDRRLRLLRLSWSGSQSDQSRLRLLRSSCNIRIWPQRLMLICSTAQAGVPAL